jgi:hypothetical protein
MTDTRSPRALVPVRLARAGLAVLLAGLALGRGPAQPPAGKQPPSAPPQAFADWPKDAKPDAVLVVTGQTFGYLQPCGCSRPQLGGLERRANFVAGLKAKGWPVAGVDVGDVLPLAGVVPEQVLLKYAAAMHALREMGYLAVGVGKAEFANGLFGVLARYAGEKERPPVTLAANVTGVQAGRAVPRADAFLGPGRRAMVEAVEVAEVGAVPVGVVGVVGPSVRKAVEGMGPKTLVGFTPETDALATAVKELAAHPKKPRLNVLLFQGTPAEAKQAAKDFPQFRLVVCLPGDGEPGAAETVTGPDGQKTLIVSVWPKGQSVGVVGAFQAAAGGFDLRYELVSLGESFTTPGDEDAARKANPVLPLLDAYAAAVRNRNLIGRFPRYPTPPDPKNPKVGLSYVGSEACAKCHPAEFASWKESKHAHAFEALEKLAKRPAQRQFDGECALCHTVGLVFNTGYRDAASTPHLKHVGCEACHGPGSGHSADGKDAALLALQSPWRDPKTPGDRLPAVATMEKIGKLPADRRSAAALTAAEKRAVAGVSAMCAGCHDQDNDPNFDLFTYWPKVAHPTPKK